MRDSPLLENVNPWRQDPFAQVIVNVDGLKTWKVKTTEIRFFFFFFGSSVVSGDLCHDLQMVPSVGGDDESILTCQDIASIPVEQVLTFVLRPGDVLYIPGSHIITPFLDAIIKAQILVGSPSRAAQWAHEDITRGPNMSINWGFAQLQTEVLKTGRSDKTLVGQPSLVLV
jgi:hypothetical protein